MINKKKKYTYEELEELFLDAQNKTIKNLNNKIVEAQKETGKENPTQSMIMNLQNMLCLAELYQMLFKGEDDE